MNNLKKTIFCLILKNKSYEKIIFKISGIIMLLLIISYNQAILNKVSNKGNLLIAEILSSISYADSESSGASNCNCNCSGGKGATQCTCGGVWSSCEVTCDSNYYAKKLNINEKINNFNIFYFINFQL